MAIQAAALVARRAALSKARKAAKKHALKKVRGRIKTEAKKSASPGQHISWFEILFVVFLFALPNDLIDVFNITLVAKPVTIVIDLLTGFTLFLWFWFRVRESSGRKFVKLAIGLLVEVLPALGLLPVWTFLVLNVKLGLVGKIMGIIRKLLPFI